MVEKVTPEEPAEKGKDPAGKAGGKPGQKSPIDPPLGGGPGGGQLVTGGGPGGTVPGPAGGPETAGGPSGSDANETCRVLINLTQVRLNTDYPGNAASRWKFQVACGDKTEENEWTLFPRQIRDGGGAFIHRLEFPGQCKGEVPVELEVAVQPDKAEGGLFRAHEDFEEMDFHIIPNSRPAKLSKKYPCNGLHNEVLKVRFQPARPTASNTDNYFAELEFHFTITLSCVGG